MKLTVACFFALALVTAFEFSQKSENAGIIFTKIGRARVSYDSFTLVYHINLNGYLEMTKMVEKCIDELERLCNYLDASNCMKCMMRHKRVSNFHTKN